MCTVNAAWWVCSLWKSYAKNTFKMPSRSQTCTTTHATFWTELLIFLHSTIRSLWKYSVVVHTCVIVRGSLSAVHPPLCVRWSSSMKNGTDRRPFMWRKSPSWAPRYWPQQETPGEQALFQSHWSLGLKNEKESVNVSRSYPPVLGDSRDSPALPTAGCSLLQRIRHTEREGGREGVTLTPSPLMQCSCVFVLRKPLVTALGAAAPLLIMIRLRNTTHGRAAVIYALTHPHVHMHLSLSLPLSHSLSRDYMTVALKWWHIY